MASSSSTSSSSSSTESRIVCKPNTTSQIWKHFGLEGDDSGKPINADQVICRICDVVVRTKGGSTTNLYTHLKKHHLLKYSETCNSSKGRNKSSSSSTQPSIQEAFSKSVSYQKHTRKWEQLTNTVTYCLCKDMLPIYSVEKKGFRDMLKTFDPRYDLPSRKYFSQTAIPALYTSIKERVTQELADVGHFSATADMWSSQTGEPYLSYTVHFIDQNWELQSRCLQSSFLPQDHTADNIAEAFLSTLNNWELNPDQQVSRQTHAIFYMLFYFIVNLGLHDY